MNSDWLNRFAGRDSSREIGRSVHRGDGWSVVTDSHCLLAVADPAATFAPLRVPASAPEKQPVYDRVIQSLLAGSPRGDYHAMTLGDLWLWLDRLDMRRCAYCDGRGELGDLFLSDGGIGECEECSGRGWHFEDYANNDPAFVVEVCGLPFDRIRLAYWLAGELEDYGSDVVVWRTESESVSAVTFASGQWRLVAASLARGSHPGPFREYYPGAGVWWQHRHCGVSRLAAADWAAERGLDPGRLFLGEGGAA